MKRRLFALACGATTLYGALGASRAFGQATLKPRHVALLAVSTEANYAIQLQAFRDGMRERGHVEGRDIVIDIRYAGGRAQEFPRLAAELAALKPAVIVAPGGAAADAALAAAAEVPVVSTGDLVATGHAAQFARPGGRVTGVSVLPDTLNAKRMELLAELLPKRAGVLNLADAATSAAALRVVEDAARSLGLAAHAARANTQAEIQTVFAAARNLRVAGINVLSSQFLFSNRARIIDLAARAKLPDIYQWPEAARDGALMGYGPSLGGMFRQLAGYASHILSGARPADLPIEQPTRFELAINLKTAKALGIALPQTLRLRADEVIE